ncbi:DNA topoisomerase [Microvirga alba]|uniref:DNA topoisomerase n=1 Tax=Microvirga alba TaxID=2791025 RepID=A0A931BXF5_9HYPH|nr:DNA topoisomerase [Microvirga alba]MBF9235615.1 hypothetical protein [Microvirga alba]
MSSIVICEKPSQAANIRAAVGSRYGSILAAQGHLLRLEEPHEVKPEWEKWSLDVLFPPAGRYGYRADDGGGKRTRLAEIEVALHTASRVIIATDCDREGQAIGDELLRFFGFKGEVLRAMFTAEDEKTLQAAFTSLESNEKYRPLYDSAVARQQADQIYNLTMTRAASLVLRPDHWRQAIGIGRVKTPTLGLVCGREIEIRDFTPRNYFEIVASVAGAAGLVDLWYRPRGDGRIFDLAQAEAVSTAARACRGPLRVTGEHKRSAPPKPFDLPALQKRAGQWGWTAKRVLETAQALYEKHKITTYPRAETRYLPENLAVQAPALLEALRRLEEYEALAPASPQIRAGKSGTYSDKGLDGASHHAIIPNVNTAERFETILPQLNEDERRLFDLIARAWLAAVSADHEFDETVMRLEVMVGGEAFELTAKGRVETLAGWKTLFREDGEGHDEEDRASQLPALVDGEAVSVNSARVISKRTEPPARFSEGELVDAMKNAWKFVTDEAERERLKDAKGIGTPATRDTIIEGLKVQTLIALDKGKLKPTEVGLWLYELVRSGAPELVDPGATARMESRLDDVLAGTVSVDTVIHEVVERTRALVAAVVSAKASAVLPAIKRSPSSKMLEAAKAKAKREGKRLPREIAEDFDRCREYLGPLSDGPRTPSDKQVEFARKIAAETGRQLSEEDLADSTTLSAWIDEAQKGKPIQLASAKQLEWIKKLVGDGAKAPKGFPDAVSASDASAFLDKHFGKKKDSGAKSAARR